MIDSYGRKINYLRVSVTKRCNLNCSYCGACSETSQGELTPQELEKIVRAFAGFGITKVRLTGGEPLVRQDICQIARRINDIEGIRRLALTTNGIFLKDMAEALKSAGVRAINISLDTTDTEQYRLITGYDGLKKVFQGIEECQRVGIESIRLNAVLIRGRNDNAAESLINIARDNNIDVRFIELMPFSDEGENNDLVIRGDEILSRFPYLKAESLNEEGEQGSAARYYKGEGFKGRVGLITPVSEKFCSSCNRIRLLSDGKIKPCLGNKEEFDLRNALGNEKLLKEIIEKAILSKPMEHKFSCGYGKSHGLNKIGG